MITSIRTYLLNAYTALPLLMCLLIASWSTQAKTLTVNHHYSGEEMFRGLFFLEGRYAKIIPELQSLQLSYLKKLTKSADVKTVSQLRSQVVQYIQAQQPRYFDNLQIALESGNPIKVQMALESGRIITAEAVKQVGMAMHKGQYEQRQVSGLHNGCTIVAMCLVVFVIDINSFVLVSSVEEVAQSDSKLLTEQLVASICHVSANPS